MNAQNGILLAALTLTCATGCNTESKPTPQNYLKAINAYLVERPECLLPNGRFPLETTDPAEMKRMNTLVDSQLLTATHEAAIKESRYVPTDLGAKYAPHFCYGHPEATTIVSSTPPAVTNGFKETSIVYQYAMRDVPVWAKSDAVKAAFPEMARKINGNETGKTTLAQTGLDWHVPD